MIECFNLKVGDDGLGEFGVGSLAAKVSGAELCVK
jgi:hypothetical protein